ncbi:MAG: electron transport complex subunit E [Pseudomonadota bacterium]
MTPRRERIIDGLWRDNPGLVQLLGLCPLLAVSGTFVNGLGLGIATLLVVCATSVLVSMTRRFLNPDIRIPIYVLIIASLVTCVELLFEAYAPGLDRALGIFVPLIAANCVILARAEVYASQHGLVDSLLDGLMTGLGFALLLIVLGLFRELLGHGTLFANMHLLFGGEPVAGLQFRDGGWLLVMVPPGAFFSLGLAIAIKTALDHRRNQREGGRAPLRSGRR